MDMELTVTMLDGNTYTVKVGNPDRVRWDMTRSKHNWPSAGDAPFLMTTFMAWSALKREGLYSGTWEQFSDTDCVDLDTDAADAADAADAEVGEVTP